MLREIVPHFNLGLAIPKDRRFCRANAGRHPKADNHPVFLPFPEEIDGFFHLRIKARMHRTAPDRLFHRRSMRVIRRERNMNFRRQPGNPANRHRRHFFDHRSRRPLHFEAVFLLVEPENGQYTCAQSRPNEIRRRESFPFPAIIQRSIGKKFVLRRSVGGFGMQIPEVNDIDLNAHQTFFPAPCTRGQYTKCSRCTFPRKIQ